MYLQRACRKSIPCEISECQIIASERHATQNEKTFAGEQMKGVAPEINMLIIHSFSSDVIM